MYVKMKTSAENALQFNEIEVADILILKPEAQFATWHYLTTFEIYIKLRRSLHW
jgi:hypothetical protein